MCVHCAHEDDTAEHTIFHCPHLAPYRVEAEAVFEKVLIPEDVPDILLGPAQYILPEDAQHRSRILLIAENKLKANNKLVSAILSSKEEAERERQRLPDQT